MRCHDTGCKCPCHRWNTITGDAEAPKKPREPRKPAAPRLTPVKSYAPSPNYRLMTDEDWEATKHGTYNGYRWHVRNAVAPCDPCRAANAEYMDKYRKKPRQPGQQYRERLMPVDDIREAFEAGASVSALSKEFGADRRTINRILGRGSMRNTRRGHDPLPEAARPSIDNGPGTGD